jgi:hypothetical protein
MVYPIAATESLRLGLALEVYLELLRAYRLNADSYRFVSALRQYVAPFYPQEWAPIERTLLNDANVPEDIEWLGADEGRIGFSPANPDLQFFRNEDGSVEQWKYQKLSRSFLCDWILAECDGFLAISPSEQFFFGPHSERRGEYSKFVFDGQSSGNKPVGVDNPSAITAFLEKLSADNGCSQTFGTGRKFGKLLGAVDVFYPHHWAAQNFIDHLGAENTIAATGVCKADESWANVEAAGKNVLEDRLVCASQQVETAIRLVLNRPPIVLRDSSLEDEDETELERERDLSSVRMKFWLGFGNVLGLLHDSDTDFRVKQANRVIPREFQLLPSETLEKLLTKLSRYEQQLCDSSNPEPGSVVLLLSPFIEDLSKKLWPDDFRRNDRQESLGSVFHTVKNRGRSSPLERRFANIAHTLYVQYRNTANHQHDTFNCSIEEARFFAAGVRALVYLSNQIVHARC